MKGIKAWSSSNIVKTQKMKVFHVPKSYIKNLKKQVESKRSHGVKHLRRVK